MSKRADKAKAIAQDGPNSFHLSASNKELSRQEDDMLKAKQRDAMYQACFNSEAGKFVLKDLTEVAGLNGLINPNQAHHCLTFTLGQQDIIKRIVHISKQGE